MNEKMDQEEVVKKPRKISESIYFTLDAASQNLTRLAKELANNYFVASSLDLIKGDSQRKKEKTKKDVFKNHEEITVFNDFWVPQLKEAIDTPPIPKKFARNILIIGAGGSYDSFANIPLGKDAIKLIKEKIIVARCSFSNKSNKTKLLEINMSYMLDFYKEYEGIKDKITADDKKYKKQLQKHLCQGNPEDKAKKSHLLELFLLEYSMVKEIAQKYSTAIKQWNLLNSIYSREGDQPDFETFLGTIADILPKQTVRQLLSEIYNFKNAPTLFYSIVAHLFKNRFLDVVINFNFDELLDTAIEEEIGANGYKKIISDGDCVPLNELTYGGRLRQPLYIKPHGTTSHKSSLRFTKDQYHNLPVDIRETLIELISCSEKEHPKKVNLICVGFNMDSIEFNEILCNNLPEQSTIFTFFNTPEKSDKIDKKVNTKQDHLNKVLSHAVNYPEVYFIPNDFTRFEGYLNPLNMLTDNFSKISAPFNGLDNTFYLLHNLILEFFQPKYVPRDIYRHYLTCFLFGNKEFWKILNHEHLKKVDDVRHYCKDYFQSFHYFLDKIIIEVGIEIATNRGKLDTTRFMEGNGGKHYREYLKLRDDAVQDLPNEQQKKAFRKDTKTIEQILQLFPLIKEENPLEELGIRWIETKSDDTQDNIKTLSEQIISTLTSPKSLISKSLKHHIEDNLKGSHKFALDYSFNELIKKIVLSSNSKIHSNFHENRHHVFQDFSHSDILNTDLQLDLSCMLGLARSPRINAICLVADYGYQLRKMLPDIIKKAKKSKFKIYFIVENQKYLTPGYQKIQEKVHEFLWDGNSELLKSRINYRLLKDILSVYVLPIQDHNRHMVLFTELTELNKPPIPSRKSVHQAIYYYKKGLSKNIAPISLEQKNNTNRLLDMFKNYSSKSRKFMERHLEMSKEEIDKIDWLF